MLGAVIRTEKSSLFFNLKVKDVDAVGRPAPKEVINFGLTDYLFR